MNENQEKGVFAFLSPLILHPSSFLNCPYNRNFDYTRRYVPKRGALTSGPWRCYDEYVSYLSHLVEKDNGSPTMNPFAPRDGNSRYSMTRSVSLAPYNIILHGDREQSLLFIVRVVMELTRFCRAEATNRMWEAYHIGRAVIMATHLERAELFAEEFQARGLRVTVEEA
jgi:ATP-dependent Clp protease adaptor protein ClpS